MPLRPMKPIDYDVYVCSRDPGSAIAAAVADGLTQKGFRVFVPGRDADPPTGGARATLIDRTPDFVVVTAATDVPPGRDGPGGTTGPLDHEIEHAITTGRNLLWIAEHVEPQPPPQPPSPHLASLKSWQFVSWDPGRSREAVAILSHRLLSSQEVEDRLLMRRAKQATIATGLMLLMIVAGLAIPPLVKAWNRPEPLPPLPPFEIHWAAFAQRQIGGTWSAFKLTDGAQVVPDDRIRLVFMPGSDGYVFVIATDTAGTVRVLHPDKAVRGLSRVNAGQSYEVPGPDTWLTIDRQAGLAGVFLIGSHDSLENLEELAEETDGEGNPKARLELLASTLDGLLDGRHAGVRSQVANRRGQVILRSLGGIRAPENASATLADGSRVAYPFASERGLVSAAVEIRVRFQP